MIKTFRKYYAMFLSWKWKPYSSKEAEIHSICKKYNIENYTINEDYSIDVYGSVDLYDKRLHKLPLVFNRVEYDFDCGSNELTSLKGSPTYVGGDFFCTSNVLKSLEYSPEYVGNNFYCGGNKLRTLEYCPNYVGNFFACNDNKLTSLKHLPIKFVKSIQIPVNKLPKELKNYNEIFLLVQHQEEYGIWNADGSFNKGRFKIFHNDFKAGILD